MELPEKGGDLVEDVVAVRLGRLLHEGLTEGCLLLVRDVVWAAEEGLFGVGAHEGAGALSQGGVLGLGGVVAHLAVELFLGSDWGEVGLDAPH